MQEQKIKQNDAQTITFDAQTMSTTESDEAKVETKEGIEEETTTTHSVVSKEEWLKLRLELLVSPDPDPRIRVFVGKGEGADKRTGCCVAAPA